ncbi:MAG: leucine-rich repeat domain-containing protein [Firmicutes bacterium]|nr:leucine-rich repeat domain-containing protein [Bacillota bacterium]
MKKRYYHILIAVILAVSLFAAVLYAEGDDLSYSMNGDGSSYSVTGIGHYWDSELVIPESYNGLPVTSISTRAFEQNKSIVSVYIPDSVTTIGDFAFSGCSKLREVRLSNSLVSMGKGAFYNCTALENADLNGYLSVIGDWAFWNCQRLKSVSIPGSISSIGIGAFSGCTNLSDIRINDGLSSLSQYLFADCTSLRSITLPSNVASVGEYAFADCYGLEEIFFRNSHVNINGRAFYGVSANAHYSCSDSSWNEFNFSGYGGELRWVSHTNTVHFNAVAPSETSPGNIEYWYCSDCGRYFADAACTKEISEFDITISIVDAQRGDVDGNGVKNEDDVLRSLYHIFFGDAYKVNQDLDFNGDGAENEDDVLRLLYNIFFGNDYPLS